MPTKNNSLLANYDIIMCMEDKFIENNYTQIKMGFTLAEVLITLAIIGVVAALTIPTIVKNYKDQQAVVKLKKAYSTLSNTTNLIISQEGVVKDWNTSIQNTYGLYKKYLKVSKDCGTQPGCMPQTPYKYLYSIGSSGDWDNDTNRYKMVLADGSQFSISDFSASCGNNNPSNSGSNNICAIFAFDINGVQAPNQVGRDLFLFVLQEKGIRPAGCDIEGMCQKGYSGYACACKVIREGKIDY